MTRPSGLAVLAAGTADMCPVCRGIHGQPADWPACPVHQHWLKERRITEDGFLYGCPARKCQHTHTQQERATMTAASETTAAALAIRDGQDFWDAKQLAALAQLGIKDASNADLAVFMHYCQKTGLDPFSRQIYMIGRKVKDGGQYVTRQTIQVGIDGYRVIAQRAARDAGVTLAYGNTTWYDDTGAEYPVWVRPEPPAAAAVTIYRDGKPFPGVARFGAFAATNKDGELMGLWATMGDHQIAKCTHGNALIRTDRGALRMRDIVNHRLPVKVRSIDLETGKECWQPVTGWWRNGTTRAWVRIKAPNGVPGGRALRVTPEHPLWTPLGWRPAGDLSVGDMVAVASPVLSSEQEQVILGGLLGDGSLGGRKVPTCLPHYSEAHGMSQRSYLQWKAAALASLGTVTSEEKWGDGTGRQHPAIRMRTRSVPVLYQFWGQKPIEWLNALGDLGMAVWFMDDGGVKLTGSKLGSRALALHCCGFGVEFADAAAAWLTSRYGVRAGVLRRNRNPYVMISSKDADRILDAIASYVRCEGSRKIWVAGPVEQGYQGSVFVPVLAAEHVTRADQRYDLEVADTHTFISNGFVLSNCAEAQALRKAFPHDLVGIHTDDESGHAGGRAPSRLTVASQIVPEPQRPRREERQESPPPDREKLKADVRVELERLGIVDPEECDNTVRNLTAEDDLSVLTGDDLAKVLTTLVACDQVGELYEITGQAS